MDEYNKLDKAGDISESEENKIFHLWEFSFS